MADTPTSILEQIANGSPAGPGKAQAQGPWLDPQSRESRFFDQQYGPILKIALKRNVDPALLLGLAAHESGYGTSRMYRDFFNPNGSTPRGGQTPGLKYPSYDAAWQDFDRMWGARIQDVGSDSQAFIRNLLEDNRGVAGTDGRGMYNSLDDQKGGDPEWVNKVVGLIQGVRNRLPYWQGNLDSYP